ncbi:methyl-accepting chemotaxis protein [Pontibacter sp. JAM-7]
MRLKVFGLSGLLIVLTLLIAATAIVSMDRIKQELTYISHEAIPVTEQLTHITVYQLEQEIHFERAIHLLPSLNSEQSYLSQAHSERQQHEVAQIQDLGTQITKIVNTLQPQAEQAIKNAATPEQAEKVSQIMVALTEWRTGQLAHQQQLLRLLQAQYAPTDNTLIHVEEEADKLTKQLEAILLTVETLTHDATERALEHEQNALIILAISAAVATLVGILISSTIASNIVRRLDATIATMQSIAEGDLTHTVDIDGSDEISHLQNNLEQMRTRLQVMIQNLGSVSDQLSATSEELATTMNVTSGHISQQQQESETLSAAMHEMSATAHEIANNITLAAGSVQTTHEEANSGNSALQVTVNGIRSLAAELENSSAVVRGLEENTATINRVLQVITDIAEQTNLLALNAAIEAARAGDSGRGFSVVADEVRNLAIRTQDSVSEIGQIITTLQQGSKSAVQTMEVSREQAHKLVDGASTTEQSLMRVTEQMTSITDMSNQIATASEEQSHVVEEMTRNLQHINDLGHQNSANAEETCQAGLGLAQMAEELNQNIRQFKI